MATYRLYLLGDGGHFKAWEKFDCASDDDAIAVAHTKMGDYSSAELWHWGRPIAVISTEADVQRSLFREPHRQHKSARRAS